MLRATAIDAAGEFMERLTSHITDIADPAAAIVEVVAYTLESLPSERYVGLLLTLRETRLSGGMEHRHRRLLGIESG